MAKSNYKATKIIKIGKNTGKKTLIALLITAIMGTSGALVYDAINAIQANKDIAISSSSEELQTVNNQEITSEEENVELNEVYNEATYEIADFLDGLDLDNDLQYFYAFYTFLNDGMFSENGKFSYSKENLIDDLDSLGFDCIIDKTTDSLYGAGAKCTNEDAFFTDVLEKSKKGFEVYSTPCFTTNNPEDLKNETKSNHQMSIVSYDGQIRYYDITNGAVADSYFDVKKLISTPDKKITYVLNPEDSLKEAKYVTKFNTNDEVKRINELINDDSEVLTDDKVYEEFLLAKEKIDSKQDYINDFNVMYQDNIISRVKKIQR